VDVIKGTKSNSPCPDRGAIPQIDGTGSHGNAYKKGTRTKVLDRTRKTRKQRARFPKACSGEMYHYDISPLSKDDQS
jgi:hypothetical protein